METDFSWLRHIPTKHTSPYTTTTGAMGRNDSQCKQCSVQQERRGEVKEDKTRITPLQKEAGMHPVRTWHHTILTGVVKATDEDCYQQIPTVALR